MLSGSYMHQRIEDYENLHYAHTVCLIILYNSQSELWLLPNFFYIAFTVHFHLVFSNQQMHKPSPDNIQLVPLHTTARVTTRL
jgi:hypothetical protein